MSRAQARPLRTALSIVAGQPVAVQSPASHRLATGVRLSSRCLAEPGAAAKVARGCFTTSHRSSRA